jgi:hypothetical protein
MTNIVTITANDYCHSVFDGTHATPKPCPNGYKLVTSKNITNDGINTSDAYFISEQDYFEINKRSKVYQWDILFSMIGTVGNLYLEEKSDIDYAIKNIGVFSCRDEFKAKWLFYYLQSPMARNHIKRFLNGAVQKFLSLKQLRDFPILPFEKDKISIVEILSALDKKIALNKQINARLEEMAKTLYDYWFVQFDFPDTNGKPYKSSGGEMVFDETLKREIPKGWEVKSLGEIISLERGVTYSKDSICNDKNGIGILRATNISGNNIDLNDLIYISGEVSKQQKLRPFDILIVMSSGSKEHIGKNGVYYFEQDNAFGAFCSKITPQKVFFEFISIFLQSNNFRNYVKNQCLGTNINNLNNSHILHCPIVRPNDEYIEAFHKQIKLIYEKISCNEKQNHQLTQLRDFLLPMLMNGQVSVAE